jgi:hypothetical protein
MKIYGYDYTETRNACEHCGFLCFDDEIWCPHCNKKRESLLGSDADEKERRLKDYHHKYEVLRKASKRGWILLWVFLCLEILVCLLAFIFFCLVQTYSTDEHGTWMMPFYSLLLVMVFYLFALGQPGLQYTRIKETRFMPFRFARGLFRRFRDGFIAELVYTVGFFFVIGAVTTLWAEVEGPYYYEKLKVIVSKELYMFVSISSLYAINFSWFLWHFLGNFLCPYDYKSELNMRLQEWKK